MGTSRDRGPNEPLCTVCKKNRVKKHEMPQGPFLPVCDECQRAGSTRPGERKEGGGG